MKRDEKQPKRQPNQETDNKVEAYSESHSSIWSGPLPPPQVLKDYNSIVPNAADRIIKMAEKQEDHRIAIESIVVDSNVRNEKFGVISGLVIGLSGLTCATICALYGHDWVAAVIGGSTLVSLVSVFVIGKSKREKELSKKAESGT